MKSQSFFEEWAIPSLFICRTIQVDKKETSFDVSNRPVAMDSRSTSFCNIELAPFLYSNATLL